MATDTGDKSIKGKKPKRFKWTIRLGVVLVIYTVVGFFVVPAVIKSQMLKRLPALTKRQAFVEQVKCNPYALSLTIRGFALKEANGDVFSSFDEFYANFQLWASLFSRSLVFDEISLKEPFGQVIYQADGNFNFANLLTNSAPVTNAPVKPAKPQELPAVTIYNFSITNASLSFADLNRKVAFHTEFKPIDIHLTNLTTIRDKSSPYSIVAKDDSDEVFAWKGTVTVNPLRSAGEFRLGGLRLAKYSTYSHDFAKFKIVNGRVDVAADYRYDSATNALDLTVSNAAVHLSNLKLKAPDTGEMVISIPSFDVTKVDASVANLTARVGLVKSSGGSILVRQNHDSIINLLALLNLPTNSSAGANPTVAAATNKPAAFSAKIDEIAFDNYTINAEDQKPAKAAKFKIDQLAFDIKNVSNASNAPVTMALSLRFQDTGIIAVTGTATLMPPAADLQLGVTNIDLRAIQPYVEEQIKLAITSGTVDVHGHARYSGEFVQYDPATPVIPDISFDGDVAVNKFVTADDVLFKDFAKWDALNIDGIHVQTQPPKAHVDQIKFTGLNASLIIGPDHRANLQTILRDQIAASSNAVPVTATAAPPAPVATTTPASPPLPVTPLDVSLGAFVLENASLHFADQSIEPHCAFDVQQFGGSIKGLSLEPTAIATIDLTGKVDDRSPFSVSGKLRPGKLDAALTDLLVDLTVAFTNTELTAFTPYTEKFAGRPLQKGKLSFGVHYAIEKKTLKAENGFYIDQFTFGAKNDSLDATKLPVKLAVALLKDRHGRIALDVPLSGSLNDPKFKVGPIIWGVVVNLIEKAATSPFSLLGAAFGGGPEMSFVSFTPGQAAIPDTETNKLTILAKALYERPEVSLEINGSVDPVADRAPLARAKLDQQIKSLWVAELTAAGKPPAALDQVQLDPTDHERLVTQLYAKTFGTNSPAEATTNATTEKNVAPIAAAAPAPTVVARSSNWEHGATQLIQSPKVQTGKQAASAPTKAKSASAAANTTVSATTNGPALGDMETQLAEKIEITQDDFRDLMNQRAKTVQAFLLQGGKITGERLFVTAPKPMNATSKGEDKVNLSLE